MDLDENNKQLQNLFRSLQNNPRSVFYTTTKLTKALIKKAQTAAYVKDKVFANLHDELDDKDFHKNENLSLVTPYIDKRTNIDHSTLYSFNKPFEILHVDIADLRFLSKSAADPKYCLLLVDLFTSKINVYPMKNRSLLAKKLELIYNDNNLKEQEKCAYRQIKNLIKTKLNNLMKNLMLKCIILNFMGEKLLLQNRKLENVKRFY